MSETREVIDSLQKQITILKKQVETLERTNARLIDPQGQPDERGAIYLALLDSANDGILLMDRDRFIDCNEKALEIFGCSKEHLLNRSPDEFSPVKQRDGQYSKDAALEKLNSAIRGKPQRFNWLHLRLDGSEFDAEVTLNKVRYSSIDYVLAIVRDVSENRRIEQALRDSEHRFRSMVETINDWVWEVDNNGFYTYVSPKVKSMLGYDPEYLLGKSLYDIMPSSEVARLSDTINEIISNREPFAGLVNTVITKDGNYVVLEANGQPIFSETGDLLGYRGVDRDITERIRVDNRFKMAANAASDLIYEWEVESRTLEWFGDIDGMLGYDKGEIPRTVEGWYSLIHPNDIETITNALKKHEEAKGEGTFEYEYRIRCKDGSYRYWIGRGISELDAGGKVVRWIGSCQDITDRKETENRIKQNLEEISALKEVSNNFSSSLSVENPIKNVLNKVYDILKPDLTILFLKNENDLELAETITGSKTHQLKDIPVHKVGECLCGLAVKEKQPLYAEDIYSDSRCTWDECKLAGFNSFAAIPLVSKDEVIGILGIASVDKCDFAKRSGFIEAMANDIAIGIQNTLLHEKLQKHAFELEKRIAERKRAELRLQLALKSVQSGVWEWNVETGDVVWDARIEEIFGLEPGTFNGRYETYRDAIYDEDLGWVEKHIANALLNESTGINYSNEHRILRRDGQVCWIHLTAHITRGSDGRATWMIGVCLDITERKVAEEKLKASEEKHRTLFERMAQGVIYQNADGEIILGNPAAEKILGLTLDQLQGRTSFDLRWNAISENGLSLPGDKHPSILALKTGQEINNITMGIFNPVLNEHRWLIVSAKPLYKDGEEKPYAVFATFDDITELKKVEKELRESQEALAGAQRLAHLGNWEIDVATGKITGSDEFYRIHGYEPGEVELTRKIMAKHVPDEEKGKLTSMMEEVSKNKTVEYDFRIIANDGKTKYIWSRTKLISDNIGNPVRIVGTLMDITERKLALEALKTSEEKLLEAHKLAHLGYWIWDVKTGEVQWSEEVFRIFRLNPDEFKPQIDSILDLSPWPEDNKRDQEIMQRAIENHEPGSYEQKFLRPDGSIGYYVSTFQGIYNDDGELVAMKGTVQDITERKTAEIALSESEENLRITLLSIGDAVITTDANGMITQMNPIAEKITGWLAKDAVDRPLAEVFNIVSGDTREPCVNPVDKVMERGEIVGLANHTLLIARDGTEYQIADSGAPIRDTKGNIVGVVMVFRDVTERYEQERLLRDREQQLSRLMNDIPGAVYQCLNDDNWTMLFYSEGVYDLVGYYPEDFINNKVIYGKLIHPDDRERVWGDVQVALRNKVPFELVYRIRTAIGQTKYMWEKGQGVFDDSGELQYIEGIHLDITERINAEEALKKSERLLKEAQSISHIGSFRINLITKEVTWSDETYRMFGYSPGEIHPTFDLMKKHVHPDDLDEVIKANELTITKQEVFDLEFRFIRKDGEVRNLHAQGNIEPDDFGNPLYQNGTIQDITESKKAQDALLSSYQTSDDIIREIPIGFFIYEYQAPDKLILKSANPEAIQLTGINIERTREMEFDDIWNNARESGLTELYIKAARTGETLVIEDGYYKDNLIAGYYRVRAFRIPENRLAIAFEDISERKFAEEALKNEKDFVSRLMITSPVGIITLDTSGVVTFANLRAEEILGLTRSEMAGRMYNSPEWKVTDFDLNPLPDHKFPFRIASETKQSVYNSQLALTKPDGQILYLSLNATPLLNEDGEVENVIATISDITERKKAVDEINRNKAKLESIFRVAPTGIGLVKDREIVEVNKRLTEMVGYSIDELKGKSSAILYPSKEEFEWVSKEKSAQIAKKGTGTVETRWQRKNGEIIDVLLSSTPIKHDDLEAGVTFTALDITQRKRNEEELKEAYIEIAQLKDKLEQENIYLQQEIALEHNFHEIIGGSASLQRALHQVEQVAHTDSTVLILGETGTGKELFARAIHNLSDRRNHPLVKINCAALPANLIESELFGHEKGAFTGAISLKQGRFELANGGTIFLDEIGDIPLELQAKLLRVLQESEFEHLGGTKTIRVDVRVIAATNRDLSQAVESGKFREDLFHRLNVFPITIPPLRERREDIPLLINHFVNKYSQKIGKSIDKIPKSIMDNLTQFDWPGNVRGLENIIERAVIISKTSQLELGEWETKTVTLQGEGGLPSLEDLERDHIIKVLKSTSWKVSGNNGAANILKMKPTTLEARMKKLGIKRPS